MFVRLTFNQHEKTHQNDIVKNLDTIRKHNSELVRICSLRKLREFPIQLIIHASVVDCSIGTIFSHIKQNMTVRFTHPTGGRVAKKI